MKNLLDQLKTSRGLRHKLKTMFRCFKRTRTESGNSHCNTDLISLCRLITGSPLDKVMNYNCNHTSTTYTICEEDAPEDRRKYTGCIRKRTTSPASLFLLFSGTQRASYRCRASAQANTRGTAEIRILFGCWWLFGREGQCVHPLVKAVVVAVIDI